MFRALPAPLEPTVSWYPLVNTVLGMGSGNRSTYTIVLQLAPPSDNDVICLSPAMSALYRPSRATNG